MLHYTHGKHSEQVTEINFKERIKKLENLLNMWQARKLSIKGKITLLRAQAMPLILYTSSVLYISDEIVNKIETLFFKFLWPKDKHHVKKEVIIQEIEDGGLKMPDAEAMIKAVKLTWVQRLIDKDNAFTKVAGTHTKIFNFKNFFKYKNDTQFIDPNMSPFYRQIVNNWFEIHSINPTSPNEVLNEFIRLNKFIAVDSKPIKLSNWSERGINTIYDIVDNQGKLLSKQQLEQKYGVFIDQMQYNRTISAIPKNWLRMLRNTSMDQYTKNEEINVTLSNITKTISNVKCKDYYWHIVRKKHVRPTAYNKLGETCYYVNFEWKMINMIPYICARETSLQSLQYQLINRYIPCRYTLSTWYKNEDPTCNLCNDNEIDTLEHYFFHCPSLGKFWRNFKTWWTQVTRVNINLGILDILLGVPNYNNDTLIDALNFCILFAKYFIHKNKKENQGTSLEEYKQLLKKRLDTEKYILYTKEKNLIFEERWQLIINML